MVTICILDDHDLLREGIKSILHKRAGYHVSSEFKSGTELLNFLRKSLSLPDIILLDAIMPSFSGLEVLQLIKKEFPDTKVLMFSFIDEEEFIINLIRAGASGFLSKNQDPLLLFDAIDQIMKFGRYVTLVAKDEIFDHIKNYDKRVIFRGSATLTKLELEIIRLSASDLTYDEISREIGRSIKTIDNTRGRIFKKLHIKTRASLVKFAFKMGLLNNFSE